MTAISGEKTALRSKVKTGGVRWSILAMLFIVTTVNYADRSTLSIAGDAIQKTLGINAVTMGYLFSAFGWTYLISQIPSGYLLDRFGAKKVYGCAIVLWSAFTMAQGAIGNFSAATAVGLLFLLRLLVGLFEGPSFPGNSKIVAAWFPTKERGFAAAIFNSAQYFATVVFTPLMGWLVVSMGWEHVFTVIGGIGVVLGFVWLVVIYSPAKHPRLRQPELEYITEGGAVLEMDKPTRTVKPPKGLTGRYIKALLSNRMLLGIYVGQYFINTITWFFLTWFPVYLVQDRGMSILKAGFVAVLPALCGFIGGILGGFVSDRLLRHGGEPAHDGSPNQPPPPADLSSLDSSVESYIRAGVRGNDLVVAVSNSTGYSLTTVAHWIQQRHPELKRKSPQVVRKERREKKRRQTT
jgi:ACS family glucarate transporter-like MFS transporter